MCLPPRSVPLGLLLLGAARSSKMPLANTPAVLNLLDGPVGVDLALHVVWARFRMTRRYWAYCPDEEPRIFRMLDLIARRAPDQSPVHLLLISAAELGFTWDGDENGWVRPSLPLLRMMAGRIQHFFSSVLDAWRYSVFVKLSERVFGVFSLLIFMDLYNFLSLPRVWNGFLLGQAKKDDVPCQSCGKKDGDGHLFWECTFPPLLHVRELPEFASLISMDSRWPRCLLWHGWLSGLSCDDERSSWAASS